MHLGQRGCGDPDEPRGPGSSTIRCRTISSTAGSGVGAGSLCPSWALPAWFATDIRQLYGVDVAGVEYQQPTEPDVVWPGQE